MPFQTKYVIIKIKRKILKNKKKFYALLFAQILAIGALIGGFLFDFDEFFSKDLHAISQNPTCNLSQKSCDIVLEKNKKINLSILPLGIPLMKNLDFIAQTKNINANILHVKIYATNMQMGTFKFELKKVGENLYKGVGMLPTCIVGGMNWNADISGDGFENIARFNFKTEK